MAKHGHLSIGRVVNAAVTINRPRQKETVSLEAQIEYYNQKKGVANHVTLSLEAFSILYFLSNVHCVLLLPG